MTALPLLRAPPFPGVAPMVASLDAGSLDGPYDITKGAELARTITAARVGGCFWGRRLEGRRRLVVLGPDDPLPPGSLADAVIMTEVARKAAAARGALVVARNVDPWPLIEAAAKIVAPANDEVATLALATGRQVVDHAGRPVTDERGERIARALLGRAYRDPFTDEPLDAVGAIALLEFWRSLIDGNRGLTAAAGMALWKRPEVARLLWDGRDGKLSFLKPAVALARARRVGGTVAAWPARVPADFAKRAAAAGVRVHWVEDGFLRSAGLGSDLLPPLSLSVDDGWPYFDPARASRLETILTNTVFDPALLARAAALRETIVTRRIGKYRVGGAEETLELPLAARLVVVVGQVEDDLSVLRGGGGMTNLSLIQRARAAEPAAFIVYRPHPDVEAGHRRGAIADEVALAQVDRIDRGGSLDALLARADTLHTLTSLTGFEALLRGVRVVVHGGPFYAGWGLTEDRGPPLSRRVRRLSLDELVAGALIIYPRYLDPRHGLPCTPEQFISGLGGSVVHASWLVRLRRWQGRLRRLLG